MRYLSLVCLGLLALSIFAIGCGGPGPDKKNEKQAQPVSEFDQKAAPKIDPNNP